MRFFRAFALVLTISLVACASKAPAPSRMPDARLARGEAIGLLVEAAEYPAQYHHGITVAGNFRRSYQYEWGLQANLQRVISTAFSEQGIRVVDLRSRGIASPDLKGLMLNQGGTWQITPGKEGTLARLKQDLGLKAVVLVKHEEMYIGLPVHYYANASGIYSGRSMFGSTSTAIAPLFWNVWMLDPIEDAAQSPGLRKELNTLKQIRPDMWKSGVNIADIEAVTADEFQQFQGVILKSVAHSATEVVREIGPQ